MLFSGARFPVMLVYVAGISQAPRAVLHSFLTHFLMLCTRVALGPVLCTEPHVAFCKAVTESAQVQAVTSLQSCDFPDEKSASIRVAGENVFLAFFQAAGTS